MAIRALFPTLIFRESLDRSGLAPRSTGAWPTNATPLPRPTRPAGAGRRGTISAATRPTVRSTACISCRSLFDRLRRRIDPHVKAFAGALHYDLAGRVAGDDRLLGQRHAGRRRAFAAPASDLLHQRHLLRRRAEGGGRAQVRGPAAWRCTWRRRRGGPTRPERFRPSSACRRRRAIWSCSRAGCVTRCRRRASPASASRLASTTAGLQRGAPSPAAEGSRMRALLVSLLADRGGRHGPRRRSADLRRAHALQPRRLGGRAAQGRSSRS